MRSCDIVDLSSLFILFSIEKFLSPVATPHGKVSSNLRAVIALGNVAATSPRTICSIMNSAIDLCVSWGCRLFNFFLFCGLWLPYQREETKSVTDKLVCCLPPGELSLEAVNDWQVGIYVIEGSFAS